MLNYINHWAELTFPLCHRELIAHLAILLGGKAVLATTAQQYAVYTEPGYQQGSVSLCPSLCYRKYRSTQKVLTHQSVYCAIKAAAAMSRRVSVHIINACDLKGSWDMHHMCVSERRRVQSDCLQYDEKWTMATMLRTKCWSIMTSKKGFSGQAREDLLHESTRLHQAYYTLTNQHRNTQTRTRLKCDYFQLQGKKSHF